jgi:hypothetical protein|tara:strand:+ start:1766 stop:1969 length:204 start_codon:yes stop_codon:yes gene_type:complete
MTKNFGDYNLSINLRNGVGLDLEFTESRAVWVILDSSEKYEAAQLEGIIICLPFCVITFGQLYLPED